MFLCQALLPLPGPSWRARPAGCPGPPGGPGGRGSAAPAEERPAQPPQRREQVHPRTAAGTGTARVTPGELAHQQGGLFSLALWHGRAGEHAQVTVETRAAGAGPAVDGRHPWRPAAHCYLLHDSPTRTTAPGPGRVTLTPHKDGWVSRSLLSPFPATGLTNTARQAFAPWARVRGPGRARVGCRSLPATGRVRARRRVQAGPAQRAPHLPRGRGKYRAPAGGLR